MKIKNYKTGEIKECDTTCYCDDMDIPVTCPECAERIWAEEAKEDRRK